MATPAGYRIEAKKDLLWIIYNMGGTEVIVGTILKETADQDPQLVEDVKAAFDAWFYRRTGIRSQLVLPTRAHILASDKAKDAKAL